MNRFTAILTALLLVAIGSGGLSAVHQAVSHSACGASGHGHCATQTRARSSAPTCADDGCAHDRHPVAPTPTPSDRLPDDHRPGDGCGFCVLLAMPAHNPAPPAFSLALRLLSLPLHAMPESIAIGTIRCAQLGARAPPRI